MVVDKVIPFPNEPWFLPVCSVSLLKTLVEKKKLLITTNFSFSLSVFYPFEKLSIIFNKFEIVVCEAIPTQQNFGPDRIESICRRQINCNKNDYF